MLRSLLLSIVGTKKEKNLSLPNTKLFITRNYRSKNEKKKLKQTKIHTTSLLSIVETKKIWAYSNTKLLTILNCPKKKEKKTI